MDKETSGETWKSSVLPAGRSETCVICPESHRNLWQSCEEKLNLFQCPGERMTEATCPSPQLFVDLWRFLFRWVHTERKFRAFWFPLFYHKEINRIQESFLLIPNRSSSVWGILPTSTISQSVRYPRHFGLDLCVLMWGSVIFGFTTCLSHGLFFQIIFRETKWGFCIFSSLVKLFACLSEAESFSNIVNQCLYVNYRDVGILNWLIHKCKRKRLCNGHSLVQQQDSVMS